MSATRVRLHLWFVPAALVFLALTAQTTEALTTFWEEDFSDVSDWTTFQTVITTDGNIGTITANVDWGKAETSNWSSGTFGCGPQSDWLHVECTGVTGRFLLNIMGTDYVEHNLLISAAPGVWDIDLGAATGWTGWQAFKIVVWVEWALPASASFDYMSVTSTADRWEEEFEPIQVGWRDDNTDPGFNAVLTDLAGPFALLEEIPGVDWGKALSPVLTINVDEAPTLTAVVNSDADMSNFLFGIQEEEGDYRFFCLGRGYEPGVFQYDYKEMLQWSGVHTFSVHVAVESRDIDGYVVLDRLTLDCSQAPPVPQYACCFDQDETCYQMTHWDCLAAGGTPYDCYVCDWAGGDFTCPLWRACCVGEECVITTETGCAGLNGEWHPESDSCEPNPCLPPEYACCFPSGLCDVMTEDECVAAGGILYAVEDCDPNPCPPPEYACCFELDEACYMLTQAACLEAGGTWHDGQVCTAAGGTFDCPLWRVCCVNEVCSITTEIGCGDVGGIWHVEWTSCGPPNPCEIPVPVSPDSWGAIKSVYR
jgi:hypothetical protein